MSLLRVAKAPAIAVTPATTVIDAIRKMEKVGVGAVVVLDQKNQLQGTFTERDVMLRVILGKKDPETTTMQEVMTTGVVTIRPDTDANDAVSKMWENQIRHLPIVRKDGTVEGIVEIQDLFYERFEDMTQELDSLAAYIATDGPGG
jgi:CBS domain-containing protein